MEELTEVEVIKGIPVINFDFGCNCCKHYIEDEYKCKLKVSEELHLFSCIFCLKFEENKLNPIPIQTYSIEDLKLLNSPNFELRAKGVLLWSCPLNPSLFYSKETRLLKKENEINKLLNKLNLTKEKSSPEARKLRKNLRKLGFKQREKK